MNLESVKKELNSYIYEKEWIEEKENDLKEIQSKIFKITSTIKNVPEGKNPINDRILKYITEIEELTNETVFQIKKSKKIQNEIEKNIDKLEQPYKNILYLRYVKGMKLKDVSEKIGLEYKYTCYKHGIALEMYRKEREENVKC